MAATGNDVIGPQETLRAPRPPAKVTASRNVGFVFQHYALFRHMSVFENVAFGLRIRPRRTRPGEAEIRKKVGDLLDLVQLGWLADRAPSQLSGGQRQRIALARALAVEPQVLLLDEPFGALDAKVRKELRAWLRQLHDKLPISTIFVTHDQEEALDLADRIIVMNKGHVEQVGSPEDVHRDPATSFVYDFLGSSNEFAGLVNNAALQAEGIALSVPELANYEGKCVRVCVRPHHFGIHCVEAAGRIAARVERVVEFGAVTRAELSAVANGKRLELEFPTALEGKVKPSAGTVLYLEPGQYKIFANQP